MNFIAELCQNHNGDLDNLLRMVESAALGGATHIKTQHIYVRNLTFRSEFEEGLTLNKEVHAIKRPWKQEYERLKSLELSLKDYDKFIDCVRGHNLIPMTTCFARCDIKEIFNLGFEEIKVASYDCGSYQMIRELIPLFKKIFVSTGASFDQEVIKTNALLKKNNINYELLHCVTIYPTPLESMNLNRILWLKEFCEFVGFSDHSKVQKNGILAAKAATIFGVNSIERHFTDLAPDETKDGPVSINFKQLIELVEFSKLSLQDKISSLDDQYPDWQIMKKSKINNLSKEELLNRNYYRGRFASSIEKQTIDNPSKQFIYNWEET